jgi:hypothetical protein
MKKENCKMSFYASIYSSWIGVAKANGYALSIYGNFENNLTLIGFVGILVKIIIYLFQLFLLIRNIFLHH